MRRLSLCSASTTASRSAASSLAATSAVGWPRATSIAKLGPDSTPTRARGRTARAISWPSQPVPCWKPLHSHTIALASTACGGRRCSMSCSAAIGVAMTINPSRGVRDRALEVAP